MYHKKTNPKLIKLLNDHGCIGENVDQYIGKNPCGNGVELEICDHYALWCPKSYNTSM